MDRVLVVGTSFGRPRCVAPFSWVSSGLAGAEIHAPTDKPGNVGVDVHLVVAVELDDLEVVEGVAAGDGRRAAPPSLAYGMI
jgi:hypothetical protein